MNITNEVKAYRSYSLPQFPLSSKKFKTSDNPLSLSCSEVAKKVLENTKPTVGDFTDRIFDITLLNDAYTCGLKIKPNISAPVRGIPEQYDMAETCGLTFSEFAYLKKFYNTYSMCLDYLSAPIFLPRNYYPGIPFSLVLIPRWYKEGGIYVLLKTHGTLNEVDQGSYYKVTWALELNKNELYVFRSALLEQTSRKEKEINNLVSNYPTYFVSGTPVSYKGNWRCRCSSCCKIKGILNSEEYRHFVRQKKNVEKIGYIMKYEGETLWDRIVDEFNPLTQQKCCKIAQKYALTLSFLHELNIIHCDQKPENIFLSDYGVKLGDFGFATMKGKYMHGLGTLGYVAPEISIRESKGELCIADFSLDIWAYGCVCADLFGTQWTSWCYDRSKEKNWYKVTKVQFELEKDFFFPKRKNLNHPHFIIDQCLQLRPEDRPTVKIISQRWKKIAAYKKKVVPLKKVTRNSL